MNNRQIPIFPLDIVVFPGEIIPLHIFEPRYLDLVKKLREGVFDSFGINTQLHHDLQPVGTSMVLTEIKKEYSDGRIDIEVRGISRYLLEHFHTAMPGYQFPGGQVIDFPEDQGDHPIENEPLKQQIAELFKLLNIREKMPILTLPFHSYTWAPYIGLPLEKRYVLLKTTDEKERQAFIQKHVDQILPVLKEAEEVKKKVQSNGHLPEYYQKN